MKNTFPLHRPFFACSLLALGIACLYPISSHAGCSSSAPASGASVLCDTSAPNPDTIGITAPSSTSVTVTVQSAADISTAASTAITVYSGTVNNSGNITTSSVTGTLNFAADGNVTNSAGATISNSGTSADHVAVDFQTVDHSATSSLDNSGSITTAGSGDAVDARGPLHLINRAGAIISSVNATAVDMGGGGTADNAGTLTSNFIAAIRIYTGGSVRNRSGGMLISTSANGVFLADGSSVVNDSGATISGPTQGVNVSGVYAGNIDIIVNAGTIVATNATGSTGALFDPGAASGFLNAAGGSISGAIGIHALSGPLRLRNAGTITGTGGTAVQFDTSGDTLSIEASSIINGNAIDSAGDGTLALTGSATNGAFDSSSIGTQYQGFTSFAKRESGTWTLTGAGAQDWSVEAGTLIISGTAGSGIAAGGTTTVATAAALGGSGTLNSQTTSLNDSAAIDQRNGTAGEALTLGGALSAGNNALVYLETALGDSSSLTDQLLIQGNLNITAPILLNITNVGGSGNATSGNGIRVITVNGTSPANAFQLAAPLAVGNYRYALAQGSDGNWYLRSSAITVPPIPATSTTGIGLLIGVILLLGTLYFSPRLSRARAPLEKIPDRRISNRCR